MQIFYTIESWLSHRQSLKGSLGFVATMGNLHRGHAALIKKSKQENKVTVVSIFINPTQFNNPEDYLNYPQTLPADLDFLKELQVDCCFIPDKQALYPDNYSYQLHETQISLIMEGYYRPNHFNGMLTVVAKLFQLVRPTRAYFGEKDYQQYLLIQSMVVALFLPVRVIPCATVRESSGLAYSSRNNRLSPEELSLAHQFAQIFHKEQPKNFIYEQLQSLAIKIDYLEEHWQRRFVAVFIGATRLIDNYALIKPMD